MVEYQIVNIRTIESEAKGSLSFFESGRDIPFDIKRVYFISGVHKDIWRGWHAKRDLIQMLWCPYGCVDVLLDDGNVKKWVKLDKPSKGLVARSLIWRDLVWHDEGSVLAVAASDYYDESDFIHNYDDYLSELESQQKQIGGGLLNCSIALISRDDSMYEFVVGPGRSVKRAYWTYGVPGNTKRGGHAHRDLWQRLVCPHGAIEVLLDDGERKESVLLDDPSQSLAIGPMVWHDMIWRKEDSVLLVMASDYYLESDYIRSYGEFEREVESRYGGSIY